VWHVPSPADGGFPACHFGDATTVSDVLPQGGWAE
jgi:hypothetical protein